MNERSPFRRISYQDLNARQKESYNFHKVAAVLADYGFNSIRITDDWESADFIAAHVDGSTFLKVQLKGRLCFYRKYCGNDLWIAFRDDDAFYLYHHDELLDTILAKGILSNTKSWDEAGGYSFPRLSSAMRALLESHRIK